MYLNRKFERHLTPVLNGSLVRMLILLLLFCIVSVGCKNASSEGEQTGAKLHPAAEDSLGIAARVQPGQQECYNYMVNGDTVVLTIKWLDSNRFTGTMRYQLKEKDRNIGTLEGKRTGQILLADYTFSSEGLTSKRQVAFKKMADYLVEGYGAILSDSASGEVRFSQPDALHFDLNRKIQQVTCL